MPTLKLDIWLILAIVSIGQSLFLIFASLAKRQSYRRANLFLGLILGLFIWLQLEFLAIRSKIDVGFALFYGTRFGAWYALGPLVFFYVKALIDPNFQFRKKDYRHFIPFLLFAFLLPSTFAHRLSHLAVDYGMLVYVRYPSPELGFWYFLYLIIFCLQFIHLSFYLYISQKQVNSYEKTLRDNLSNIQPYTLSWLKRLLVWAAILVICILIFLFPVAFWRLYIREMDYVYILPMVIITYLISYRLLNQPTIFRTDLIYKESNPKYKKSALISQKALPLKKQLEEIMEQDKPYLDNQLKLENLAQQLGVPPYQLSQLLNEHFQKSFFDFVNGYRVEEVKQKLQSPSQKINLLEVAFESGFNNKTSFINHFKKNTGTTPSQYLKKIR